MLATLTMAPPCARIQASTTSLVSTNGPRRLTSNVLSQALSSTSRTGPKCGLVPALFTRMSMRPKRSITLLTNRCESSGRPTCATIGVTAPAWRALIRSAAPWRPSSFLLEITTLAPWSASAPAVASPMPRLPPVTIATRSVRSKSGMARYYPLRMDFDHSPKVQALQKTLVDFMVAFVYPNERTYRDQLATRDRWRPPTIVDELKSKARSAGLWNLFLPESDFGAGLTNLEYAPLCEIMGRVPWAPEVFNCSAPDTGNMEILDRYGTPEQKDRWLRPLLDGKIRSGFAMTEPDVASSDATNIKSRIVRDGDDLVINGRKWWTSGAMDPRCQLLIFMGKTDPENPDRHRQQSMVLVPRDAPGVAILRWLPVFGFDDAPHGHAEVDFVDVRVPASNILLGEGRGFEIAQARLGPGRIHHCMRLIGLAEVGLELMCKRVKSRVAFGKPLAQQSVWLERIAQSRILIDEARLLTLNAAYKMDTAGNKAARTEIAMIKVAAPNMLCTVLDWAIQAHGAAGVSDDFPLAHAYAYARTVRIVDGPDEVHLNQLGRLELGKY